MQKLKLVQRITILFFGICFTTVFLPLSVNKAYAASSNDVIYGGVSSLSDLVNKINSGTDGHYNDLKTIFNTLGICPDEFNGRVNGASHQTVEGYIYENGKVVLADDTVVASGNIIFGGRDDVLESSPDMSGIPVYWRHASESSHLKMPAYIHLINGKFSFAVIKDNGNPVRLYGFPSASLKKEVRNITKKGKWSKGIIKANRGDVLEYRLTYKVDNEILNNVWIYDALKGATEDGNKSNREYLSNPWQLKPSQEFLWYPNGINIAGYKTSRMLAWYSLGRASNSLGVAYFRTKVKNNTPDNTYICNDGLLRADGLEAIPSNKVCVKVELPKKKVAEKTSKAKFIAGSANPNLISNSNSSSKKLNQVMTKQMATVKNIPVSNFKKENKYLANEDLKGKVIGAYTEKNVQKTSAVNAFSFIGFSVISSVAGAGAFLRKKIFFKT